ncbi:MAG: hypothetical protein ABIO85_03155 [Sphingomicrobium sp.]
MRKLLIGAAFAASALTAAAPAAAQYYPQRPQYGYKQPQYGQQQYGYAQNNYGQTRVLYARVDQIRQQIRVLDRRNILSQREAYRLDIEAQQLRQRLQQLSYGGLNPNERYDIERRIQRLEQAVRYNASDRNGRYDGRGTGFGGNGYYGQYQNQYQYQYQNQQHDGRWNDRHDDDDDNRD